jgi:hypothetical protein
MPRDQGELHIICEPERVERERFRMQTRRFGAGDPQTLRPSVLKCAIVAGCGAMLEQFPGINYNGQRVE